MSLCGVGHVELIEGFFGLTGSIVVSLVAHINVTMSFGSLSSRVCVEIII